MNLYILKILIKNTLKIYKKNWKSRWHLCDIDHDLKYTGVPHGNCYFAQTAWQIWLKFLHHLHYTIVHKLTSIVLTISVTFLISNFIIKNSDSLQFWKRQLS